MLGLHKHILDFDIVSTGNTKTLIFIDTSQYMESPERPLLEVLAPGYNKYFLVNYFASEVTTFNSSTLGFKQVLDQTEMIELPDGIWTIKQKICPYDYVYKIKKYMRVDQLLAKISTLNDKLDLTNCDETNAVKINQDLIKIYNLIEGAKSVVNKDCDKAKKYYDTANRMVQSYLDKLCKNC